ncbi:AraC family transcriptional regulator [Calothrix sp. NIES-4071]|nr:AraC family transcriptional regulator [Calothrix sp. NIES-4071]BAZ57872.1 AraC family transcriptional regulator [Calothrix sp. NIES-4105]
MKLEKELPIINLIKASSILQILPRQPILSSAKANWSCIQFGYHRQPACETPEHLSSHHVISICVGRPIVKKRMLDGIPQRNCFVDGDISITPANRYRSVCLEGEAEFIHIYPEPKFFARTANETVENSEVEIIPQFKIRDPLILGISLALKTELELNPHGSQLYAESLASTLAVHLIHRYSTKKYQNQNNAGGLPKYKLQQAIDYIKNHDAGNISLEAIATELGMSRYYFARLFKQSTGLTPHQYIIKCRVNQAKQLLTQQSLSIKEISRNLGFANQNQFATFFYRYAGVSPKEYRQKL